MKIIELLNKIANGEEVPEKINYGETLYSYDEGIDYKNKYGGFLMGGRVCICPEELNNEVEIIEEPQEHKIPEKIDEETFEKASSSYRERLNKDKINEILDYLEANNGIMD